MSRANDPKHPRWRRPLGALAALLFAVACYQTSNPTSGETHFLTLCESSAECGGLACLCGVCTRSCDGLEQCRDFSRAECLAEGVELCETAAPPAICDVRCAADTDCSPLSSAHRCEAGRCRAGQTGGGTSCPMDMVGANQVLVIGDSFFGASHQVTAYLEELARSRGALSTGERYRDYSSTLLNTLSGIADQYAAAAAEADVRVTIMNGGGADALVATCDPPDSGCPALVAASAVAEELLARMAGDGVEHVVYAYYPETGDALLDARLDALRPLVEGACAASPVPCHWLDLREIFTGSSAEYLQPGGILPTATGSQATATAIGALLEERCIAQ